MFRCQYVYSSFRFELNGHQWKSTPSRFENSPPIPISAPSHSDVTRPGGWPIFEKWYISEHQFQLFIRFWNVQGFQGHPAFRETPICISCIRLQSPMFVRTLPCRICRLKFRLTSRCNNTTSIWVIPCEITQKSAILTPTAFDFGENWWTYSTPWPKHVCTILALGDLSGQI